MTDIDDQLTSLNAVLSRTDITGTERVQALLQRAKIYGGYLSYKPEWAVTDCNDAIGLDPTNADAFCLRAKYRGQLSDRAGELADYTEAIRLDPQFTTALRERAWHHANWQNSDEAIADWSALLNIEPTNVEILLLRAETYKDRGCFDLAIADINTALSLPNRSGEEENDDGYLLQLRAEAHEAKAEFDLAVKDWDAAVAFDPTDALCLLGRGDYFNRTGDYARAIADFNASLANDPENTLVLKSLAKCCSLQGNLDAAIDHLTTAITIDPKNKWSLEARANYYVQKCDLNRATADWDELVRRDPADVRARNGRAEYFAAQKNYDPAIADFTEVINLRPLDARAFSRRASCYTSQGHHDKAIEDWTEVVGLVPDWASGYEQRGDSYVLNNDHDRAIADYSQAIRRDPNNLAYYMRGTIHSLRGEPDLAIPDFTETIRLAPNHSGGYYSRGLAYCSINDSSRARSDFERVLQLPDSPLGNDGGSLHRAARKYLHDLVTNNGRRIALVIGNASYQIRPLVNPVNDATAIAAKLQQMGFDHVGLATNVGGLAMRAALKEFGVLAANAAIAVVYFSGHGAEEDGRNYLIPIDAKLQRAADLEFEAVSLNAVLAQIEGSRQLRLVVLDACRSPVFPLAGSRRSTGRGLGHIEPLANTLVAYAAKDGTTAEDGLKGGNSPFTTALLRHIGTPGIDVTFVFRRVRDEVITATRETGPPQEPHLYGTLGGEEIHLVTVGR